jgi:tetratricopeptide (TPR) repeat protein
MAGRAIEEDPRLAQAYAFLGAAKLHFDRDWEGAEKAILKGLELNPQVPTRMPCTVGS